MKKSTFLNLSRGSMEMILVIFVALGFNQIIIRRQEVLNLHLEGLAIFIILFFINLFRESKIENWKVFIIALLTNYVCLQFLKVHGIEAINLSLDFYLWITFIMGLVVLFIKRKQNDIS